MSTQEIAKLKIKCFAAICKNCTDPVKPKVAIKAAKKLFKWVSKN